MLHIVLQNSKFWPFYHRILRHKKKFEKMLDLIDRKVDSSAKLLIANEAAQLAVSCSTGYWSSYKLERVYLDFARQIPDVVCCPQKNTVLHVLTQCYSTGGHTRVVERWIKNSPLKEVHSIILLDQKLEPIPGWLKKTVAARGGDFCVLNEDNQFIRAHRLREFASSYERIILHSHMEDGTPIMAFGIESFTTPIILFNHADHLFWLGVSIADIVADIRYNNKTEDVRLAAKSFFLGIPQEDSRLINEYRLDKKACRKKYGLSVTDFVIVSTGNAPKYHPISTIDYVRTLLPLVAKYPRLKVLAIGADPNSLYWIEANKKTDGRIMALGKVNSKQQYYELLKSADLYIGTFPLASYTAMMDAVQVGLPFLQLQVMTQENTTWGIDIKEDESVLWPKTLKNLSLSIEKAVCEDRFYVLLQKESQRWLLEYSSSDWWKKRMNKLYQICPKVHKLHIWEDNKNVRINDECLTSNLLQGTNDFYYVNKFINVLAKKLLYISIK